MEQRESPKYKVGDRVRVVDSPYEECPFGWAFIMDDFCGRECVIIRTCWNWVFDAFEYHIRAADTGEESSCMWCDHCFIPLITEEDDFDISGTANAEDRENIMAMVI